MKSAARSWREAGRRKVTATVAQARAYRGTQRARLILEASKQASKQKFPKTVNAMERFERKHAFWLCR